MSPQKPRRTLPWLEALAPQASEGSKRSSEEFHRKKSAYKAARGYSTLEETLGAPGGFGAGAWQANHFVCFASPACVVACLCCLGLLWGTGWAWGGLGRSRSEPCLRNNGSESAEAARQVKSGGNPGGNPGGRRESRVWVVGRALGALRETEGRRPTKDRGSLCLEWAPAREGKDEDLCCGRPQ